MDTTRDLITVFGGIFALLTVASLIGAGLKWRLSPAAPHPVIDNLNTRIKAWWAMILLIGAAIWAGKGGVIALFAFISFQSLREFISLTHTRLGDHRALLWVFFVFLPLQYAHRHRLVRAVRDPDPRLCLPAAADLLPSAPTPRASGAGGQGPVGLMICVYCLSHVPALLTLDIAGYAGRNALLVVFLVLTVQSSDVFQYVWGKLSAPQAVAGDLTVEDRRRPGGRRAQLHRGRRRPVVDHALHAAAGRPDRPRREHHGLLRRLRAVGHQARPGRQGLGRDDRRPRRHARPGRLDQLLGADLLPHRALLVGMTPIAPRIIRHDRPLPAWLEAFRHRLGAEVVETHISWLLLAGDTAWKLKKPSPCPSSTTARPRCGGTSAPKSSASTAASRPASTWGSTPSMAPANGRCGCGASRKPAPRPRLRPRRAWPGAALPARPGRRRLPRRGGGRRARTRFGEPAQVLAPALDNFATLRARLPGQAPRLDALEAWTRAEFARIEPTLAARKAGGRIRECHGDLHLGNLVLLDGQVCPFDCIEFSDDLRWIDVASELAFTYMDLLDHRRPDLAAWLLDAWLRESGDFQAVPVLRFYSVYKALVRAKVAALGGAAPRPAATWPSPNPSPPRRRPG
jgi:hypothetical protein